MNVMRQHELSKGMRIYIKEKNIETGSRGLYILNFFALIIGELRQLKEMKE